MLLSKLRLSASRESHGHRTGPPCAALLLSVQAMNSRSAFPRERVRSVTLFETSTDVRYTAAVGSNADISPSRVETFFLLFLGQILVRVLTAAGCELMAFSKPFL